MSSSLQANALSALSHFNETFSTVSASTGAPVRPPAGTWANIVTGVEVNSDDVKLTLDKNAGLEIPGVQVTFHYRLSSAAGPIPPNHKDGEPWMGRSFILPAAPLPAATPKGKRQNLEIQGKRLKGHISTLLGVSSETVTNVVDGIRKVHELVSDPNRTVLAMVQCKYEKDEKNPDSPGYFEEFIPRLLGT